MLGLGVLAIPVHAQSGPWDETLSNTFWYVPVPQLLAYGAAGGSFSDPFPIGDQTLWTLGNSVDGVFTGTSDTTLKLGPVVTSIATTMNGIVTDAGQTRIVFTDAATGTTTIGVGQMRQFDGSVAMEMQMLTGSSLLVTHWAYMLPYDPVVFTPPPATAIPVSIAAPEWKWTEGTRWHIASPSLFGTATPAKMIITDYINGYFWGQGVAPDSNGEVFSFLGSITPEGNVLYSVITEGKLSQLYGQLLGGGSDALMLLRTYLAAEGETSALIRLVRPYVETVTEAGDTSATAAAGVLYELAGTRSGLNGEMAPVFDSFDQLRGADLSAAITQTLPLFVGAGLRATYNTQRVVQQTVLERIDAVQGLAADAEFETGQDLWIKPFGNWLSQGGLDDIPGYDISGGGLVLGFDQLLSPTTTIGGVLAYASNQIIGQDSASSDVLNLNNYQFGLYGTTRLALNLELNGQIGAAVTRNSGLRSIDFQSVAAASDYDSRTGHIGIGLRQIIAATATTTVIPSLRVDYAQVNTDAYTETGAGTLNLNVDQQRYEELLFSAGLRGDFQVSNGLELSLTAAAGYNALNNQTQITAAYEGGGASFVTYGEDVSPWLFSLGIGLFRVERDGLDIALRYDLQASPTGYMGQTASLRLTHTF
jgi:outer membrane autotransporter protein